LRKTLPKDFEELLKKGNLPRLQSVFDACLLDARGGSDKQTALAFCECPDELARWLVAQGADLLAADTWGKTPLHTRAQAYDGRIAVLLELGADVHAAGAIIGTPLHAAAFGMRGDSARLLLQAGAQVNATNREGLTPLELALRRCSNVSLPETAALIHVLLDAGAARTTGMKAMVARIGERFEFHRMSFNEELLAHADRSLADLYATFDVPRAPQRRMHDATSPIAAKATSRQAQHAELWELLVPSGGPAQTVQGEVIRIAGRIAGEWTRNGGINWDQDYDEMGRALVAHVGSGVPLSPSEVGEMAVIVRSLRKSGGAGCERLAQLAVQWVLENPHPAPLSAPKYRR
jgi:hypothetical protein